ELAAGEDDDRHFGERLVGLDLLQYLEAGHVRQAKIEHHAVALLLAQRLERAGTGAGGDDLDVVMAEELGDRKLLARIVLDDEETSPPRLGELLDARERRVDALGGRRLGDEGEGAARQRVLTILVERDDLHRDV